MNLHKQRKFILIASAAGIISIFLPWKSFSAGMFGVSVSQGVNGFHDAGIVAMLCFGAGIAFSLIGEQSSALQKNMWLGVLATGSIAFLATIINMIKTKSAGGGFVEFTIGWGCWLAMLAAIATIVSAWLFRNPDHQLKESLEGLKKNISSLNSSSTTDKKSTSIEELEKLIKLKEEGHITEAEYQQMKSKLL